MLQRLSLVFRLVLRGEGFFLHAGFRGKSLLLAGLSRRFLRCGLFLGLRSGLFDELYGLGQGEDGAGVFQHPVIVHENFCLPFEAESALPAVQAQVAAEAHNGVGSGEKVDDAVAVAVFCETGDVAGHELAHAHGSIDRAGNSPGIYAVGPAVFEQGFQFPVGPFRFFFGLFIDPAEAIPYAGHIVEIMGDAFRGTLHGHAGQRVEGVLLSEESSEACFHEEQGGTYFPRHPVLLFRQSKRGRVRSYELAASLGIGSGDSVLEPGAGYAQGGGGRLLRCAFRVSFLRFACGGRLRHELYGIKFLYFRAHGAEGRRRFQRGKQRFGFFSVEAVFLQSSGKLIPRAERASSLERGAVGEGRIDRAGGKREAERAEKDAECFLHGLPSGRAYGRRGIKGLAA